MTHYLVDQLRFTRSKWVEGLRDVDPVDATRRFEPMNSIGWMIGHLAYHEQRCWLEWPQNKTVAPEVAVCGFRQPASTPSIVLMWDAWDRITAASDPYLDALTEADMVAPIATANGPTSETAGTILLRVTYHYWYHLGEGLAVRQLLGHKDLPPMVGFMPPEAHYPPGGAA